jgi:hypothetical protein
METPSPFPGDMSEQIVSHKLSILKREYPKRYETLESTVKTLQCNVRVRRAKKAFALRKAVSAHLPRPCLQTTPDEVMPFQLNIICRALLHGALAGWAGRIYFVGGSQFASACFETDGRAVGWERTLRRTIA